MAIPSLLVAGALAAQIAVGPGVQVSVANSGDTHYELLASADPSDARRMVVGAMHYPAGGEESGTIVYSTFDGGLTWRPTLDGPQLRITGDPAPAHAADGTAYYTASSLRADRPREMLLFRSTDGGAGWERLPPLTYSDRQYITVDNTDGRYRGRIYVNGNNRVPRTISDFVVFSSSDGGRSFQGPATRPGYGSFQTPHMGNAVVASDGTLIGLFSQIEGDKVVLYAITSVDGGASLTNATKVDDMVVAGGRKGANNNVNSQPMLAIDASRRHRDRLYAVWPDRRSGSSRIYLAVSTDLGRSWRTRLLSDSPETDTADHFMPNVAVNHHGVVAVMWYDRRDAADNMGWDVRLTASVDGGRSWLPSVKVSEVGQRFDGQTRWSSVRPAVVRGAARSDAPSGSPLRLQLTLNSFFYMGGDTAGLVANAQGTFHPFWIDDHTGVPQVWTAAVTVSERPKAPPSMPVLADISAAATLEVSRPVFDNDTSTLTAHARVINNSQQLLRGPFAVRVVSLRSELGDIAVMGARSTGNAQWTFDDPELQPGAASAPRVVRFRLENPRPYRDADRYSLGLVDFDVTIHAPTPVGER